MQITYLLQDDEDEKLVQVRSYLIRAAKDSAVNDSRQNVVTLVHCIDLIDKLLHARTAPPILID